MTLLRRIRLLFLFAAMPLFAQSPSPPALTVFAAASLKESLDRASSAWTQRSGQRVVVSYAASSALAKQIEQSAPADVFVSADTAWMEYLDERQLIDASTRFDLVGNRLVLIAPAVSALRSVALDRNDGLHDALGAGRLALGETSSVPAGRYAKQALIHLGLWDGISSRIAQGENVRAAMAFVARGEAPLGVVYATDAQAEPKVRVVATFPSASHDPIIYPVARVRAADPQTSAGFLAFLTSADARAIFASAGFGQP